MFCPARRVTVAVNRLPRAEHAVVVEPDRATPLKYTCSELTEDSASHAVTVTESDVEPKCDPLAGEKVNVGGLKSCATAREGARASAAPNDTVARLAIVDRENKSGPSRSAPPRRSCPQPVPNSTHSPSVAKQASDPSATSCSTVEPMVASPALAVRRSRAHWRSS